MASKQTTASTGDRLRALFENIRPGHPESLDPLFDLYAPQMVFSDPTQTLIGRDAFAEMNRKALEKAVVYELVLTEVLESEHTLYATWELRYQPKRGPLLVIPGVTHARMRDGFIVEHRDYWDLLSSFMDAFPVAGSLYRKTIAKLV